MSKVRAFLMGSLDTLDAILEHRVTGLLLWATYMAVQDMLKDDWIQTVLSTPETITAVPWSAWFLILGKASLPVIGGIITYKSSTWAQKAGQQLPPTKPQAP